MTTACLSTDNNDKGQTKYNLTGDWHWENSTSTFSLNLRQLGDTIKGHYCAVANNGNRVDCYTNESDDCVLSGRLTDNKAKVNFKSCYIGATGQATITYNSEKDQLVWTLGAVTSDVFAPDSVVLTRIKTSR
jgi:hypothetical protein